METTILLSVAAKVLLFGAQLSNWVDRSRSNLLLLSLQQKYCLAVNNFSISENVCVDSCTSVISCFWPQTILKVTIPYSINLLYVHCLTVYVWHENFTCILQESLTICWYYQGRLILVLPRTFNIEKTTIFIFSFCIVLVT